VIHTVFLLLGGDHVITKNIEMAIKTVPRISQIQKVMNYQRLLTDAALLLLIEKSLVPCAYDV